MLQVGTGEKREPSSLLSRERGGNQLTTQATATSAWWILPNVALARMHLRSFIQTFLFPLPEYHTAPSCKLPLPRRGISYLQETAASQTARKILDIQITFSQMRLRREGHTSLTTETSTIWSEILVLPSPMLSFWHPGSGSETCWKKACKSQIRESVTKYLQSARWAVLLQQCCRSIRGCSYHL